MTLEFFKDNQELLDDCVLWWQGRDQTTTGFPILPSGVTATPAGTWTNDLNLGNSKILKTFNGSTNYVSLTDNASFDFGTGAYTICFWVTTSAIATGQRILAKGTGAGVAQFRIEFISSVLQWESYNGTTENLTTGVTTLSSNTWYFVCCVKDAAYNKTLYVNGTSYATSNESTLNYDNSATLYVGTSGNGTSTPLIGNLKDLMIFKGRALTQPEITTLMRMTNPTTGKELELLYPGQRGVE